MTRRTLFVSCWSRRVQPCSTHMPERDFLTRLGRSRLWSYKLWSRRRLQPVKPEGSLLPMRFVTKGRTTLCLLCFGSLCLFLANNSSCQLVLVSVYWLDSPLLRLEIFYQIISKYQISLVFHWYLHFGIPCFLQFSVTRINMVLFFLMKILGESQLRIFWDSKMEIDNYIEDWTFFCLF